MLDFYPELLQERLLPVYWLLASGTTLAVGLGLPLPATIRSFILLAAARGKLWQGASSLPLPHWIKGLHVPQAWFKHFYWIGCVWNILWMCLAFFTGRRPESVHKVAVFVLLQLHYMRRAWESTWQAKYSQGARMHAAGYLVGVSFYLAGPPSLIDATLQSNRTWTFYFAHTQILGILLYLLGTVKQAQAHSILASLRQRQGTSNKYHIPRGGWFEFVSCPHFTAEVLIYVGLVVLKGGGTNALLLIAWTVANLSLSAVETHRWYLASFAEYPKDRCAICPLLL